MGLLVDGIWQDKWYDTKSNDGRFQRAPSSFRHWVTQDGAAGPTGDAGFKAESGRYHLYVSYACPWAHRALIFRTLKGLENHISLSVVHPLMGTQGWTFEEDEGTLPDTIHGAQHLHEVYTKADPNFTGRVTVPVLWDKHNNTIVNNESSEIIRMFNSAFNALPGVDAEMDLAPRALLPQIDEINNRIYDNVNNGVYKAGFATTQSAYEDAVNALFSELDALEQHLAANRYLVGDAPTEADWRLFTTLVRFDPVYVGHFKCNIQRIADYPNLTHYVRELYQIPGVAETTNIDHIKRHYYESHTMINPTGVVPLGPTINFDHPHDRDRLSAT
jgi:glutathionyl-hydroquinone reductase